MKYIDLSYPIEDAMPPYPGDSPLRLNQVKNLNDDGYVAYKLSSTLHSGTHIDVPMHLVPDDRYVKDFPLEAFCGKATMLNVVNQKEIDYKSQYKKTVLQGSKVLLYSGHSAFWGKDEYFSAHPTITEELAAFFIEKEITLLGFDFPSPDYLPYTIHKKLLKAGIVLLENLTNLSALLPYSTFELYAQPLKIKAEGSLTRAIAKINC